MCACVVCVTPSYPAVANVCKHNVTRYPYDIARIAQDLAGGLMSTLPSDQDFEHEVTGPLLRKYLTGEYSCISLRI